MKKMYFLLAGICISASTFAQQNMQLGPYFTVDMPSHTVMPKMSTALGIGAQYAYKPIRNFPVSLEIKGSLGSYSTETLPQTYTFEDSSSITTDVTYTSNMNKALIGTKIHIGSEYKAVRGYVTPQVGRLTMRSKISIADPEDEDGCEPLEKETKQRFSGYVYGAEVGAEVSMSRLFLGRDSENKHRLFLSVSFLNGFNKFEYVNVKHMEDGSHHALHGGGTETSTDSEGRDITTTFVNLSTNSLHDHKIAELYRTNLQFWGLNVGYVFNF